MTKASNTSFKNPGMRRLGLLLNAAAMITLHVAQRLLGLLSMTVISRALGPSDLGAYAFTQSTSQTFFGIMRFGLDAGFHARLARLDTASNKRETEALVGQAAILMLCVTIIGSVLMVTLSQSIALRLFDSPDLAPFVAIAAVLFFGQATAQTCYAAFAGFHAFTSYAAVTSIGTVLMSISAIAGALLNGASGASIGLAAGQILLAFLLVVALFRRMAANGLVLRLKLPSREIYAALAVGFPFYAAGLFVIPAEFVNQAMLSRTVGVEALGELRVVLTMLAVVQVIPHALAGPMLSHLSEREGYEPGSGAQAAVNHFRVLWIFALALAVAFAGFWPLLIRLIFGGEYVLAEQVGNLALCSFIPTLIGTALTSAILARGGSRQLFMVGLVQAVLLIATAWLTIPALGLPGIFLSQAVASLVAVALWFQMVVRSRKVIISIQVFAVLAGLSALFFALVLADIWLINSFEDRTLIYVFATLAIWILLWHKAIYREERIQLCGYLARLPELMRQRLSREG